MSSYSDDKLLTVSFLSVLGSMLATYFSKILLIAVFVELLISCNDSLHLMRANKDMQISMGSPLSYVRPQRIPDSVNSFDIWYKRKCQSSLFRLSNTP